MFRTFCEVTSLHGFKDYIDGRNVPWKIVWIIVIVGSFAISTYEIYQVLFAYTLNPTATNVAYRTMDEYKLPVIALCPKIWANRTKVRRLLDSLSMDTLYYSSSLILNVSYQLENDRLRNAQSNFYAYLNTNQISIYDYYRLLMINSETTVEYSSRVAKVLGLPVPKNFSIQLAEEGRFCFVYKLSNLPGKILHYRALDFNVVYNEPVDGDDNISSIFHDPTAIYPLMVPSSHEHVSLYGFNIQMKPNITYTIHIHPYYSSRLPQSNKCKVEEQTRPTIRCQVECLENIFFSVNYTDCYWFGYSGFNGSHQQFCSSLNHSQRNVKDPSFVTRIQLEGLDNKCFGECLHSCDEWHYDYFVYTEPIIGATAQGQTEIKFTFNPTNGVLCSQEVATYAWDTLLSNIGGQIGLWTGGSIISLIQIFYYIILWCTDKCSKR